MHRSATFAQRRAPNELKCHFVLLKRLKRGDADVYVCVCHLKKEKPNKNPGMMQPPPEQLLPAMFLTWGSDCASSHVHNSFSSQSCTRWVTGVEQPGQTVKSKPEISTGTDAGNHQRRAPRVPQGPLLHVGPTRLRTDRRRNSNSPHICSELWSRLTLTSNTSLKILKGVSLNTWLIHQMASSVLQILPSSHPSLLFNPAPPPLISPPWLWSDPQGLGGQMRGLVPPEHTNASVTSFLWGGR